MTNFWSFDSGSYNDKVGNGGKLSLSDKIQFTYDHNCCGNKGALDLNTGYAVIPPDIYFNSEFSIAVWVCPVSSRSADSWSRIVEFGRGVTSDNIILMFNDDRDGHFYPNFYVIYSNTKQIRVTSNKDLLDVSSWYFIVCTFESTQAKMYINKELVGSVTYDSFLPRNVTRNRNYIGGSSWGESKSENYVDDLRIYKGILSSAQINNLFNS